MKTAFPQAIRRSDPAETLPARPPAGYRIRKTPTVFVTLAFGLTLLGAPWEARGADAAAWQVTQADVRITLPMKPGGAFEARTSALSGRLSLGAGRPLPLEGALEVDLATIDTGIALRNRHMRENYLEIQKGAGFDKARLTGLRLTEADGPAFRGRTGFTATLSLHGASQAIAGTAEIRTTADGVRVVADFPLSLSDFGIPQPEYLGVGVANRILLKVSFSAASTAQQGGAR